MKKNESWEKKKKKGINEKIHVWYFNDFPKFIVQVLLPNCRLSKHSMMGEESDSFYMKKKSAD